MATETAAAAAESVGDPFFQPYNQLSAGQVGTAWMQRNERLNICVYHVYHFMILLVLSQLASGIGFLALTAWWIRAELFGYLKKQQKGSLSNGTSGASANGGGGDIEAVAKVRTRDDRMIDE